MLSEEEEDDGCSYRKFFSLYNGMRIPKASGERLWNLWADFSLSEKMTLNVVCYIPSLAFGLNCPHHYTTEDYEGHETEPVGYFFQKQFCQASGGAKNLAKGVQIFFPVMASIETRISRPGILHVPYADVVYFNGRFYSIDFRSRIVVCVLSHGNQIRDVKDDRDRIPLTLIDLEGVGEEEDLTYRTTDFQTISISALSANLGTLQPLSILPASHADVVLGVHYRSRIVVCDLDGIKTQVVGELPVDMYTGHFYMLESLGSLVVVLRNGIQLREVKDDHDRVPLTRIRIEGIGEEELTYGKTDFQVFQVDLATSKVTEMRELGDIAFFLGAYASLSVQASQFPGIKPNCIYFTDDYFESYFIYEEGGGLDMGVFNLEDGSIQPHYDVVSLNRVCPPTWVTPTLY
ncbi:hypothetical protein T459_33400 [Capsicum annuum]|uniref:KIB1-4 beta-propeller domain-containing protein n=1 Tax=Capsicum annuum TaxID=4072 RepID=A0A2G2XZ09_CAPAN|nr:hypothetical protein T459_33400 [Capsicum annuum]